MGIPKATGPDDLTPADVKAVNAAACARDEFEPLLLWLIEPRVLDRMVASGVVEVGPSCRPAIAPIGYRLSDQGWKLLKAMRVVQH